MNEDEQGMFDDAYTAVESNVEARKRLDHLWEVYEDLALSKEVESWDPKPGSMALYNMGVKAAKIRGELNAWMDWGDDENPDALIPKAWDAGVKESE